MWEKLEDWSFSGCLTRLDVFQAMYYNNDSKGESSDLSIFRM